MTRLGTVVEELVTEYEVGAVDIVGSEYEVETVDVTESEYEAETVEIVDSEYEVGPTVESADTPCVISEVELVKV